MGQSSQLQTPGQTPRRSIAVHDLPELAVELCPLCESASASFIRKIRYEDIYAALRTQWHVELSKEVVTRHTPGEWTALVGCQQCGLEYFVPLAPGDWEFYREASLSPSYYTENRFEFEVTANRLEPRVSVLDVGCGDGGFLRFIQPRVRLAVGVDTNPEAVTKAKKAGLDVRAQELGEFAREHSESFDVVCAFHLIEHLPRVQPFLKEAISCLKPGGQLIVGVPNRERLFQAELEPLDCPPHHLSRWSRHQLHVIAEKLGLGLLGVAAETAGIGDARIHFRQRIEQRLGHLRLGMGLCNWAGRVISRMVFSESLYSFYARAGWLERMGLYRHSMVAFFQKQVGLGHAR